jgi:thiamine pyrophosphokinase
MEKAFKGAAFIGGDVPPAERRREAAAWADIVVAADSGLAAAEEAGVKPDWIVGDMDSLDRESRLAGYPPERVLRYNADKDFTDTEIALKLLWDNGCARAAIIGGGGGRIDHLLAIRALFDRAPAPDIWSTGREHIYRVTPPYTLETRLATGSLVSVFPCGAAPWKAKSRGLRWSLDELTWDTGFFGISNTATGEPCAIRAETGSFLVVLEDAAIPPRSAYYP